MQPSFSEFEPSPLLLFGLLLLAGTAGGGMQLFRPPCTQLAIIGFGEARRYLPRRGAREQPNGVHAS